VDKTLSDEALNYDKHVGGHFRCFVYFKQ